MVTDYDCSIEYHPSKANVVVDALIRKSSGKMACMLTTQKHILNDLQKMGIEFRTRGLGGSCAYLSMRTTLSYEIIALQYEDPQLCKLWDRVKNRTVPSFHIDEKGILKHGTRLCILAIGELKRQIMEEAHNTPYTVHLGSTKIYLDLKTNFWWSGIKADIAKYVSQCLVF